VLFFDVKDCPGVFFFHFGYQSQMLSCRFSNESCMLRLDASEFHLLFFGRLLMLLDHCLEFYYFLDVLLDYVVETSYFLVLATEVVVLLLQDLVVHLHLCNAGLVIISHLCQRLRLLLVNSVDVNPMLVLQSLG
jgi:hypothetical protein